MTLALVGDIGGTNARFALWRDSRLESVRVLATADFVTPETAVEYYLASLGLAPGSVEAACLACAGPVKGEQFTFTNNHWRLTRRDFCGALQLGELLLINDFAAMALGMTRVGEAGRRMICAGEAELDARRRLVEQMYAQGAPNDYGLGMVDRSELEKALPEIGPDVAGASYSPHDGHVNSLRTFRAFHAGLRDFGACMSPHTAWLILQGIETLPLRLDRISDNALKVANLDV